jgi:hypothetical protein
MENLERRNDMAQVTATRAGMTAEELAEIKARHKGCWYGTAHEDRGALLAHIDSLPPPATEVTEEELEAAMAEVERQGRDMSYTGLRKILHAARKVRE